MTLLLPAFKMIQAAQLTQSIQETVQEVQGILKDRGEKVKSMHEKGNKTFKNILDSTQGKESINAFRTFLKGLKNHISQVITKEDVEGLSSRLSKGAPEDTENQSQFKSCLTWLRNEHVYLLRMIDDVVADFSTDWNEVN